MTNKLDNFDESVVSQDELDKAMEEFNTTIHSRNDINKGGFNSTQNLQNIDMINTNYNSDSVSNSVKRTD